MMRASSPKGHWAERHACANGGLSLYTIGQFSRLCRVTPKALRHYEKLGLLVPARVEPGNQYRYYTGDQAAILKEIILMKELGLPLRAIKRMIDRRDRPDEAAALLEQHRSRLLHQVDLCNRRLQRMVRRKSTRRIKAFSDTVQYDVVTKIVRAPVAQRQVRVLVPRRRRYSLAT